MKKIISEDCKKCEKAFNKIKKRNEKWNFDSDFVIGGDNAYEISLIDPLKNILKIEMKNDENVSVHLLSNDKKSNFQFTAFNKIDDLFQHINRLPQMLDSNIF